MSTNAFLLPWSSMGTEKYFQSQKWLLHSWWAKNKVSIKIFARENFPWKKFWLVPFFQSGDDLSFGLFMLFVKFPAQIPFLWKHQFFPFKSVPIFVWIFLRSWWFWSRKIETIPGNQLLRHVLCVLSALLVSYTRREPLWLTSSLAPNLASHAYAVAPKHYIANQSQILKCASKITGAQSKIRDGVKNVNLAMPIID